MAIKAVVFDIGGVLEITPSLEIGKKWEEKLKLSSGELNQKLGETWKAGSIGSITLDEVHTNIGAALNINKTQVHEFMEDLWREYLGVLNTELADYFRSLRPAYQTAIISNSFVGAREKEAERYQFDTICDFIIYSHEVGFAKPDPRIFQIACERLKLQPHEIIFVDDHDDVMTSAKGMGVHCIEFKSNQQTIAEIETCIKINSEPQSNNKY